ncbi:MAG: IS1380 family transposase [Balneolaceae bacterium]|nr:IS1380 family transposase [Balneolaceae bacterium]
MIKSKACQPVAPNTILRGIKELSQQTTEQINPASGVAHQFNINTPLNELLVEALQVTGQLNKQDCYDLDYDNQVIATEKWDAARTYKKCNGYQPAVASIGNKPVYIEGRGGNSPATYAQQQTLKRVFETLSNHQVSIGRFRADSASYQKEVVKIVENQCNSFCIRAKRSPAMEQQVGALPEDDWKSVAISGQPMDVAELSGWRPFGGDRAYRLVLSRIKRADGQADIFSGGAYTWRAILTDEQEAAEEVVAFYNGRGASERLFDVMGNDFGWSKLPCSLLSHNTAFMILTGIIANFYRYLIERYAQQLSWLQPTFRLKKFIFRFISVPAKWIRTGRRAVLKLYTDKDYSPLLA